jgi:hypothetical protein
VWPGTWIFARGFVSSNNFNKSFLSMPTFLRLQIIDVAIRSANSNNLVKFEVYHGGDYEEWRLLGCYSVWLL